MAGSAKAVDVAELAARYAAGESMQVLAAEHSVHRQRLYELLLGCLGDEAYSDLVTKTLIRRVSEADQALENPSIEPDTARAHARARFARMDLERRRPALYGAKPELGALNVTVQVVAFAQQKVLDNQAHALPEDRGRSPVALPLVDCVEDQSAQGGV